MRAERIGWIRPLIENFNDTDVLYWDYWESNYFDIIRTYIWLVKYNFVVILQEKSMDFQLITAYYVDRPERLRKKYDHRIK